MRKTNGQISIVVIIATVLVSMLILGIIPIISAVSSDLSVDQAFDKLTGQGYIIFADDEYQDLLDALNSFAENSSAEHDELVSLIESISCNGSDSNDDVLAEIGDLSTQTDEILEEVEVVEHHFHPDLSVTTPNGRLRVAAISFNSSPVNGDTITLAKAGGSSIVYTFLTDISGNPANAGNVYIKVQGTAALSAQKLMNTISAGVTDPSNVHYYNNVAAPHPDFVAPYTTQRVSIGSNQHAAGTTNVFICRAGDSIAAITLSDTLSDHGGTYKLTGGTRIYTQRYVLSGDASPATNSIAGPYQCIVPMNSVWHPTGNALCKYDVGKVVVEAISDAGAIVECDGYYSTDEVTFVPLWYGLEISREPASQGSQTMLVSSARIPEGAGFYVKMRSNLTSTAAWVDFKVQYHLYPVGY